MKEDILLCIGQKAFIERDNKVLILMEENHDGSDYFKALKAYFQE